MRFPPKPTRAPALRGKTATKKVQGFLDFRFGRNARGFDLVIALAALTTGRAFLVTRFVADLAFANTLFASGLEFATAWSLPFSAAPPTTVPTTPPTSAPIGPPPLRPRSRQLYRPLLSS